MLDQQALEKILHDPNSTEAERATAQRQLGISESGSALTNAENRAVELCGPLGLDLQRFAGAHELREVTWRDLVRFADSREWPGGWGNHDVQVLWLGWILFFGYEASPNFRAQIWS